VKVFSLLYSVVAVTLCESIEITAPVSNCNIVKFKGLYFSFKSSGYEAEIFSIISDKVSVLLNFIDNANVAYDNYTKTVGIKEEDEVFENMKQNMIKLYGYEILEACISNLMKKYVCRLMR
jgi:hypothetical protein